MKLSLFLSLVILCSCGSGNKASLKTASFVSNNNSDKYVFPSVGGKNLLGKQVDFPQGYEAEYTIAAVAFKQRQQADVDKWYEKIGPLIKKDENVEYFEIPTIYKMGTVREWFLYHGMRAGIKSPFMRQRVVTIHIDKEPFKKHLNINTEDQIYVYLIKKGGEIIGTWEGDYNDTKWAELIETMKKSEK